MSLEESFTTIFKNNTWKGQQSKSGIGSDLKNTKFMRTQLIELINSLNINHMIDAPCGDFHWMKELLPQLNIKTYLGVDIVKPLIKDNKLKYAIPNKINFKHMNIVDDILPKTDLIFCRDCLVHLSIANIQRVLNQFKRSKSTYLITTTFTKRTYNDDIADGNWRDVNLTMTPFSFPGFIKLINEGCTEGQGCFPDKSLGLWKLKDIPWY